MPPPRPGSESLARMRHRCRAAVGLWALRRGWVVAPGLESRLAWVFGSPRSGSTWLLRLLAEHPAVSPVDEPLIGSFLGQCTSDLSGVEPSDLDGGNFTLARMRGDAGPQFLSEEFADVWRPLLAKFIKGRIQAQELRHGRGTPTSRARVVIKEPNGSQAADMIMAALPKAGRLFLLRDGRDVVASDLAGSSTGSWASRQFSGFRGVAEGDRLGYVTQSAYKWLWRTEVVQSAFDVHPGPKRVIRYEDLRRDPRSMSRE